MEKEFKNKLTENFFNYLVDDFIRENKELLSEDYLIEINGNNGPEVVHRIRALMSINGKLEFILRGSKFVYLSIKGEPVGEEALYRLNYEELKSDDIVFFDQDMILNDYGNDIENRSAFDILFRLSVLTIMQRKCDKIGLSY